MSVEEQINTGMEVAQVIRASFFQRKKVTASIAWRNDLDAVSILGLFYVRLIVLISLEIS